MPSAWIDRLFLRLHVMYGKAWLDMWADAPIAEVKAQWAESLGNASAEQIRLALQAFEKDGKVFPPNLPEFVSACDQFKVRKPAHLKIVAPRYEPPDMVFKNLRDQLRKP